LVSHVQEIGSYLWEKLEGLKEEFDFITAHRGKGLMQGLEFSPEKPVGEIVTKALSNGLILISAGNNVLRFVPPLVIENEHVDLMAERLRASF
jgi:acetylornithine/N-succinyldiaminopimelate aminotransferase